jgi:hypothetical protein
VRRLNALLAVGTVEEAEDNARTGPSLGDTLVKTVHVEDVPAFQLNAGRLRIALSVANSAVVISRLLFCRLGVLSHAFWVKTGQAPSLVFEAAACMTAG